MNLKKYLLSPYTIFACILALSVVLLYAYVLNPEPAEIGQVIGAQTYLNEKGEAVVKYAFVGGKMDIAVSPNVKQAAKEKEVVLVAEDLSARTTSSRTFVTNNPTIKISEFLSGPNYYQDDLGHWWQAEYAYTTPEQFASLPKSPEYVRLVDSSRFAFIKRALADTDTFYPDADDIFTTVDGYVFANTTLSFTNLRANATSSVNDTSATVGTFPLTLTSGTCPNWTRIARGIYGFDTSAITDTHQIDSATFSVYGSARDDSHFSQSAVVDRRVPATANNLASGDFNITGWAQVEQASNRITFGAWNTTGYNDFTLNSTGLSNISTTGLSWYGLRGSGDFDNIEPTCVSGQSVSITGYFADQTGTTNDPKLVVVHSEPAVPSTGSVFKQDVIFKQGVIFK